MICCYTSTAGSIALRIAYIWRVIKLYIKDKTDENDQPLIVQYMILYQNVGKLPLLKVTRVSSKFYLLTVIVVPLFISGFIQCMNNMIVINKVYFLICSIFMLVFLCLFHIIIIIILIQFVTHCMSSYKDVELQISSSATRSTAERLIVQICY